MTPTGASIADTLQGRVAIQRGLGALEKWTDRNLMKFSEDKYEV